MNTDIHGEYLRLRTIIRECDTITEQKLVRDIPEMDRIECAIEKAEELRELLTYIDKPTAGELQ